MTNHDIAHAFTRLCANGDYTAAQAFWSDDVVSIEAFPGPHQTARGRAAVVAKQAAWQAHMTVHAATADGPFVNGDHFAIHFTLDCSDPSGKRQLLREMALYTLRDGKIVEERFLPFMPAADDAERAEAHAGHTPVA